MDKLIVGVPSKGRLMEDTLDLFRAGGIAIEKTGDARGYKGAMAGVPDVAVEFLSAGEIARHLQSGRVHLGVTGEDLVREQIPDADERVDLLVKFGFGHANVVVAVPDCWLDVETMADLEEAGALFTAEHGRRLRIATKYPMLTRRFFTDKGVVHYRTVESLGATEGAPAAGMAEGIVDITSTGATLRANGLRILADGLILQSEANLVAARTALVEPRLAALCTDIARRLKAARDMSAA
ncbi:ATP phosphoribosyltransferase catalytic subunit [Rhodomicrobium udaipurense JA643]|uniref:ATP phosphoribosyltransferase n=1 Tax=Rhodomicrobium udaipurense TaxID=1202716 RepID=A0A8I1KK90_9HYPH|nr:ATP phosphoribosyltransferase [Rhodomicrobium udaipurense]KAI94429.1 ATP phosphoribosyltransferase catalytic subunit [Rhodomicrobium udaipurense JA643]MBJ7543866.1 ATP phosphoribosyltransferase [Rhodomicrobium udaipurense]